MELGLNLTQEMKQILSAFLLIILPWIIIGLGMVFGILHAWYYLLLILWFGMGFIFYGALN